MPGQGCPDIASGPIAIVRKTFDQEGHTSGSVSLVHDRLVLGSIAFNYAGPAFDEALAIGGAPGGSEEWRPGESREPAAESPVADEAAAPVSFALSLARKDVTLAIDLAAELGVPLPQTQLNLDQLQSAEAAGFGERDMASIINYLRRIK